MSETKVYYRNKVAVVTGGPGIGWALAETMLSYGAKRVILRTSTTRILPGDRKAQYGLPDGRRRPVQRHKEEDVQSMIRKAADFGAERIDFLVQQRGSGFWRLFRELTNQDWEKAFALNFYGALYGIRAVLPIMKAQGRRHSSTSFRASRSTDGLPDNVRRDQGRRLKRAPLACAMSSGTTTSGFTSATPGTTATRSGRRGGVEVRRPRKRPDTSRANDPGGRGKKRASGPGRRRRRLRRQELLQSRHRPIRR